MGQLSSLVSSLQNHKSVVFINFLKFEAIYASHFENNTRTRTIFTRTVSIPDYIMVFLQFAGFLSMQQRAVS